jgi:hypothetical protein
MIKKFSELNESHGDTTRMIPVVKMKWGSKAVSATITLSINGYLEEGDDRTEITYQEALDLVRQNLESLAGSNDGSEMLLNVNDDEIRFKSE